VFVVAKSATTLAPPIWSQEPIRIACFGVIMCLSLLSWRYFERPLIAIGNKVAEREHFSEVHATSKA
jgi:peptidoglycan/LPS O-acetylase OafA/YrhL